MLILSQEAPKPLASSVVTEDDSAQARVPNASNKNLSGGGETRRQYNFVRTRGLITFTSFHVPCHMTHERVGLLGAG